MSSSMRAYPTPTQNSGYVIMLPSDRTQLDEHNATRTSRKRKASDTNPEPPLRPNVTGHRAPYPHNLPHGLVNGCNICPKTSRRIVCSGCRVVHYCCPEHQALDQVAHQTICDRIKRLGDLIGKTERELAPLCEWDRYPGDDEDRPIDPFGPSNPNFWYWKKTRKYMYMRRDYAYELIKLNTKTAIDHALDDTWSLLRMDPEDHLGMRCIMPWLFLRLKRDRECYDFCKWWVTEAKDSDWDWQSEDTPLTFEDAFESAEVFERIRDYGAAPATFSDLSFLLAVLLLKIRMRQDLEMLRICSNDSFSQWSLSSIVLDFHNDPEREDDREGEDYHEGKEYSPLLKEVENQIRRLYRAVGRANKHFWPAFMNPWTHLEAKPSSYGLGDEAEMQIKLQECFNAWVETEDAIGPIHDLMEGDDVHWYSMSGV